MRYAFVVVLFLALAGCAPVIKPMGPISTVPTVTQEAIVAADGAALPLRRWLPDGRPKAAILGLHGFNDYSRTFEMPGNWFAKHGIATYAYDQRGFGSAPDRGYWAGTETMTADLRAAVAAIRMRHPDTPLYILGNSMGGAVALTAFAEGPVAGVDGAILSAPAVWGRDHMNVFQTALLWVLSRTIPWATVTGRGLNRQPSDNIEMLRGLGRDPLVIKETRIDAIKGLVDLMDAAYAASRNGIARPPLLVLYGSRDEIVPKNPVVEAMRSLAKRNHARTALYDTGWHMLLRDLKAETVWRDIAAWIGAPAAPLPSGADRRAEAAIAAGPQSSSDMTLASNCRSLSCRPR